ncbi:stage II sporulation protein M [filamentous cyanobacterium LEGE 11480]|uniref:Stage II sporulation protein M n=2 Tax=Romeriopsis TaxID=2992131 RepID=A0A928Z4H2_9CYAN|nr:stage II sporulation protein M [Romeriopsis navalis LEGE 11480]
MHIQRWIARREPHWKTLELLLDRAERLGLKSLSATEIHDLASLYRSVSADLARARTHQVGAVIVQDLQKLTSRGYAQIYQGTRRQEWHKVWEFYQSGFAQVLRETLVYTMLATTIFCLSALVAWWFAWLDPNFLELIVPERLIQLVRDDGELWMGRIMGDSPGNSSDIMTNNIGVCLRSIAGGLLAGIGTVYILVFNGLLIGAIAALVAQNNLAFPFWGFVFPHGALELPAIFIAGGAGLMIAKALLFPDNYRRLDAFKIYGPKVAQITFGMIPMLLIAGGIEGFISPNPAIPDSLKYIIGTVIFLGLVAYILPHSAALQAQTLKQLVKRRFNSAEDASS